MCLYSHQISFTSAAWHSLLEDPIDPLGGIRRPIHSLGGKLVSAFFTEDSYDVLAIAEFPEAVSANEIGIAFYAGGAVATIHSSPLLSVTQADEAKRKARQRLSTHMQHSKRLAASAS